MRCLTIVSTLGNAWRVDPAVDLVIARSESVDDGLVHELPEELAMVSAQRARRLHHEDATSCSLGSTQKRVPA